MMSASTRAYGFELILDLHGCDTATFTRASLRGYFESLCRAIDMQPCALHFWDDEGLPPEDQQTFPPHTRGISAVQFILTSTIVVHTLELLEAAYVNIFSCKPYDRGLAEAITKEWFGAKECRATFIERT